jgi:hypothetical protein
MVASMATLMRSYIGIKLFFVGLFLLAWLMNFLFRNARFGVPRRLAWFYVWISLVGVTWALVGLLHQNPVQGVVEALRLYVIWSGAFVVLYTLLRRGPSLDMIHRALVLAGILIALINLAGLCDQLFGLHIVSDSVAEELDLIIGFGDDGHLEFASDNIISLFVIVPYLISLQFRTDASKSNSKLAKLALVLSLIFAALSGRRALWIVIALTPCLILVLSILTDSYRLLKTGARRFLLICAALSVIGLGGLFILPNSGLDPGTLARFKDAFSSEDYRSIQRPYLIEGFLRSPVLGSGFGANAGITRSYFHPWIYELTYHQMLFNLGIVGMSALVALFSLYFVMVVRLLRQFRDGSAVAFGLLIGFCCLLLGAYSNPYFGGFDSLFFGGLLPFLSTFQDGFDRS